jgi:hypothetical protein
MFKSKLFAITNENGELKAYPVLIQFSYMNGYRTINVVPLVESGLQNSSVLAIVHEFALEAFGVVGAPYEVRFDAEEALAVSLNNMLIAPNYLFNHEYNNRDGEKDFHNFRCAYTYSFYNFAKKGANQKELFDSISALSQTIARSLDLTPQQYGDFVELAESIVEDFMDKNGVITIEQIQIAIDNLENEAPSNQIDKPNQTLDFDDDADFFAGLFK